MAIFAMAYHELHGETVAQSITLIAICMLVSAPLAKLPAGLCTAV